MARRRRPTGGTDVARFVSKRKPDVEYMVRLHTGGLPQARDGYNYSLSCQCKTYRYGNGRYEQGNCGHIERVKRTDTDLRVWQDIARQQDRDRAVAEAAKAARQAKAAALQPAADILMLVLQRSSSYVGLYLRPESLRPDVFADAGPTLLFVEQLAPFLYLGGKPVNLPQTNPQVPTERGARVITFEDDEDGA